MTRRRRCSHVLETGAALVLLAALQLPVIAWADPPSRDFDEACKTQFAGDPKRIAECKRYCRRNCPRVLANNEEDPGRTCLRLRLKGPYPCDNFCGNEAVEPPGEECDPPGAGGQCSAEEICGEDCRCGPQPPTSTPTVSATPTVTTTSTPTPTQAPTDPCLGRSSCEGTCVLNGVLGVCLLDGDCVCCPSERICSAFSGPKCCAVDEFCQPGVGCTPCIKVREPCTETAQCCPGFICFEGFCD